MKWRTALLGPLLLLACNQEPFVPIFDPGPVSIVVTVSDTTLASGDRDTITVVVTNNLDAIVRLSYGSNCTLNLTIRNATNRVVLAQDPNACIRVPQVITIAPLGSFTRTFVWTGGEELFPPDSPTRLPSGPYFVTASIDAENYSAFSPSVRIDLSSNP
jgi:hypothetical protein